MQTDYRNSLIKICESFNDIKIEFLYNVWETDFLRFYQSQTNYNISKSSIILHTTVHKGKKSFSFQLINPSIVEINEKIEDSLKIIDHIPLDPDYVDIENDLRKTDEKEVENNIEKVSIDDKINILKKISEAVSKYDFKIYGSFICNYQKRYIINSNGINKKSHSSPIMLELKAVSEKNQVTVLETFGSSNFELFNIDQFIDNLIKKVKVADNETIDINPDKYEVVLAPRCIGEFFNYLVYNMTANCLDQKLSYFEGKLNQKIFPENISLIDDPHNPNLINFDYNRDGHIYQKTKLIENGVFKNFLVDNYYSYKTKLEKNGANGSCLVMNPGNLYIEDMIKNVKYGLYISSLHYMNFINRRETSVTGLTRDGTFLIENGEFTKVINNLRFTEKISDIIKSITEIENKNYSIPFSENYEEFSISSVSMPHVKVKDFKISSSTKTI